MSQGYENDAIRTEKYSILLEVAHNFSRYILLCIHIKICIYSTYALQLAPSGIQTHDTPPAFGIATFPLEFTSMNPLTYFLASLKHFVHVNIDILLSNNNKINTVNTKFIKLKI